MSTDHSEPVITTPPAAHTPSPVAAAQAAPDSEPAGISGADAPTAARITEAIERFAEAGLHLPPLAIHVQGSQAGCGDRRGLYTPGSPIDRIDLCTDNEFVLYHELGHVWERHALTEAERQAYAEFVGLESWNDAETKWARRGMESVAHAIAHNLLPEDLTEEDAVKLAPQFERYHFLSGRSSPRLASSA